MPLTLTGAQRLVLERLRRQAVGPLPDDDPAHRRLVLEPRGGVHDVTGRDPLAPLDAGVDVDDDLARVDGDPDRGSGVGSSAFSSSIARVICQAACTARIASSSRDVGAPNKPTTASPMNFSTVPPKFDLLARPCEVGPQARLHVLGVRAVRSRGEPSEVGEQDRNDLPLLGPLRRRRSGQRFERGAARPTEPSRRRVCRPPDRARLSSDAPQVVQNRLLGIVRRRARRAGQAAPDGRASGRRAAARPETGHSSVYLSGYRDIPLRRNARSFTSLGDQLATVVIRLRGADLHPPIVLHLDDTRLRKRPPPLLTVLVGYADVLASHGLGRCGRCCASRLRAV